MELDVATVSMTTSEVEAGVSATGIIIQKVRNWLHCRILGIGVNNGKLCAVSLQNTIGSRYLRMQQQGRTGLLNHMMSTPRDVNPASQVKSTAACAVIYKCVPLYGA